jgi:hypothetical protein
MTTIAIIILLILILIAVIAIWRSGKSAIGGNYFDDSGEW